MSALEDQFSQWSYMASLFVLSIGLENFLHRPLVSVEVSLKAGGHAEIIDVERVLVDMLKDAEFSFLNRKFGPLFEIILWVEIHPILLILL